MERRVYLVDYLEDGDRGGIRSRAQLAREQNHQRRSKDSRYSQQHYDPEPQRAPGRLLPAVGCRVRVGRRARARQRDFHKIDLIANYTLARAVGYDQDGGSFRYYPRDPQNPFSPNEFGPALNDERHHVTIAGTVKLPWRMQFSPILQAGSARPYLVTSSYNQLNLGSGSSLGAIIVPNSDPTNLLAFPANTGVKATDNAQKLAAAQCYYSGNCHIVPYNSN